MSYYGFQITLLIVAVVIGAVIIIAPLVYNVVSPEINPEYIEYIHIRDASNCTKANDTYCREMYKICIHGYEYCQRQQCPRSLP